MTSQQHVSWSHLPVHPFVGSRLWGRELTHSRESSGFFVLFCCCFCYHSGGSAPERVPNNNWISSLRISVLKIYLTSVDMDRLNTGFKAAGLWGKGKSQNPQCSSDIEGDAGLLFGSWKPSLQFLNFSFYAVLLLLSLPPSHSVSFLICLHRDRQVMEKKLKGKIQGKCKWKEVIITVIMKCLSFKYKNVTLKWTCDPEMHF